MLRMKPGRTRDYYYYYRYYRLLHRIGVNVKTSSRLLCSSRLLLPSDSVELWIVMVSMISGCMMYTVLVANATTMIANTDPTAKEYKSKVLTGP